MTLRERIKEGLDGNYQGLSNGFSRLNQYIFGIQRGCYYLLGGGSGNYKTTLVDYMLLNALQDAKEKGIKTYVTYYSFEIDKLTKQCNWLSQIIYNKHKITIPPERIKGLGDNRLSQSEQDLVNLEIPVMEELFESINFVFTPLNPTGIYNYLWSQGESHGVFIKEPYSYTDKEGKRISGYKIKEYIPNDPEAYHIVIMDHMALMKKEREFSLKEVLDKYSEYCVELRNHFKYTFINVQQFNSGLSSVERQKFKGVDLSPTQSDFKDSTSCYADSDVVLGTLVPYKLDMDKYLQYELKHFKESFMSLKIIKNRLSKDNMAIGLLVSPKSGTFTELPLPDKIDYSKYKI